VSFDVVVRAKPGLPGWQFVRKGFAPDTEHIHIRLVQAGTVRPGPPAFIDGVWLSPAQEFLPPSSRGGRNDTRRNGHCVANHRYGSLDCARRANSYDRAHGRRTFSVPGNGQRL